MAMNVTQQLVAHLAEGEITPVPGSLTVDHMSADQHMFLGSKRPFTLAEVFRERESRRRVLLASAFANGFFTPGWAYSWMAIDPSELFTSSVRTTAAS